MGCGASKGGDSDANLDLREKSKVTLKDFEKFNAIGRGGFGKVFEVKNAKTG